jgi:hypothetical protein
VTPEMMAQIARPKCFLARMLPPPGLCFFLGGRNSLANIIQVWKRLLALPARVDSLQCSGSVAFCEFACAR